MVREGGNAVNLRVHNTFGLGQPSGRLVSSVVLSAVAGDSTYIKNPYQVHDFVHVDDVADAVLLAAQSEVTPAESIEIGTGTGTSVLELARMIYALAQAPQELITFDEKSLAGSPEVADTALARELLGWQARVGLMDGLGEMVSASAQSVTPTSGRVVSQ
jgi:nucleoside-diphosphate-sugar epimerase